MNKKYVILGFMLLILGAISLLGVHKSNIIKEDVPLKNVIVETVEKSNEIDFAKITNFEWDTMYVFTPYSNPKEILKKDGISTYNSNFSIEVIDTINMIGFIKSNKLVAFVELPRKYGGVDLTNFIKFSKEESKFSILLDEKTIIFKKN